MSVLVCGRCNRNLSVVDSETLDGQAALLFFLIGAARESENMMFGGRKVTDALEGARIALGITPEQMQLLMEPADG
ncbi:MAG TPA: hypothetical protein PLI13_07575 [Paracoccus sp. (in: a-proteobacteria)]|nr:hypothetical protein [Paracoccus sp. (in: a-proteobacteria)]